MKKLRLEDLVVESYVTSAELDESGTVKGNEDITEGTCAEVVCSFNVTCPWGYDTCHPSCVPTEPCWPTCDPNVNTCWPSCYPCD